MKNGIEDLNNHLFAQLERLGDEHLTDEQIANEVKRSEALVSVAGKVLDGGRLALEAAKLRASVTEASDVELPALLEDRSR